MSTYIDSVLKSFQAVVRESRRAYPDELEKIVNLQEIPSLISKSIAIAYSHADKNQRKIYADCLVQQCQDQLLRTNQHIIFLCCNGLYRNAIDDIRHTLESIVQALYIDSRHPTANLSTKLQILREVEDKRDYHAVRLIDEFKIDFKGELKKEYKQLSRVVHPSVGEILRTMMHTYTIETLPVQTDRSQLRQVHHSMMRMYDIFYFFYLSAFPEIKEISEKDDTLIEAMKQYELPFLSKVLRQSKKQQK